MSSPIVRSIRPGDGETSSIFGEYTISVADSESRVSLYKTQIISLLAKEKYTSGRPRDFITARFDDTGANPNTGNRADFSAGSFGVRLTSDGGTHTDGAIFIPSPVNSSIFGVSATVSLVPSTAKTVPYTSSANYVGMGLCLLVWEINTEILLLFEDDGVNKSITITGPSIDGVGTRAFSTNVNYDWSTTSTFTIAVDTTRDKLYVTAHKNETDEDTVLVRESLSGIGTLLSSIQFGSLDKETGEGMHLVLINDGSTVGDEIELSAYTLFSDGYPLVKNGLFTRHTQDTFATTQDSYISKNTINGWEYDPQDIGLLNEFLTINSTNGAHIRYPSAQMSNANVMFAVNFSTKYNTYIGVNSSAGVDIYVSGRKISIRAIKFQGRSRIGIQRGSAISLLGSYQSRQVDTSLPTRYIFTVSSTRNFVDIHIYNEVTEKYEHLCSQLLSSLPAYSGSFYGIDVGVFASVEGTVFIKDICIFPESAWVLPSDIQPISPPLDPINNINSGFTCTAVSSTPLSTHFSDISYSIESSTSGIKNVQGGFVKLHKYKPSESGITVGFRFDKNLNEGFYQPKAEYGPFLSINSGDRFGGSSEETLSVQLSFIQAMDGRVYGFIGKDDNDSQEVYARTAVGRKISFEATKQAYMISYKPYDGIYIREYLMADHVLYVPWVDTSGSERVHQTDVLEFYFVPTDIATDAHFTYSLMGGILNSMPVSKQSTVSGIFHGIGRGATYRFFFNREIPLADYSSNLFRLIVDVEDDD